MALKATVKVTVNNLSDARYCAGMGVDFIGFSADPEDPFYQSPENIKEIAEWISGVHFVAEVSENDQASEYDTELIQIKNPAQAVLFEKKVILEGTVEQMRDWKDQLPEIKNLSFLLINIDSHKQAITAIIEEFNGFPLLLGYDLDMDQVNEIATTNAGLALKGSNEIKPGLKDYDELADILEALEVDEPY